MSSTLFKTKITKSSLICIEPELLIDYCFYKRKFRYKTILEFLKLDLSNEKEIFSMPFERFIELLKLNYERKGVSFFDPILNLYEEQFIEIEKSYENNKINNLINPKALVWNNILANFGIENFESRPVLELAIDIAQNSDGVVAFPNHRGLGIKSRSYREFMIRILVDLQNEITDSQRTINKWFNSRNGVLHPEYPKHMKFGEENIAFDGDEGIIWGINEIERIIIDGGDKEILSKYKNSWWSDILNSNIEYWKERNTNWLENNKEYPFVIAKFSILIHPSWFDKKTISTLKFEPIYDSTAYGY